MGTDIYVNKDRQIAHESEIGKPVTEEKPPAFPIHYDQLGMAIGRFAERPQSEIWNSKAEIMRLVVARSGWNMERMQHVEGAANDYLFGTARNINVDALAKDIYRTWFGQIAPPSNLEFGSMMSAVARAALDSAKTIQWSISFNDQAHKPQPPLLTHGGKESFEAACGLSLHRDFDPSNEEDLAALEKSMAEYGIGSYSGEKESIGPVRTDLDVSQNHISADEEPEGLGHMA